MTQLAFDREEIWMLGAACRGKTDLFFSPDESESRTERRRRESHAKTVCGSCEVRVECLTEALGSDERFGIWGGLTERERRALRRSAAQASTPQTSTQQASPPRTSPQDIAAGPGRLARLPAVVVRGRAMSPISSGGD